MDDHNCNNARWHWVSNLRSRKLLLLMHRTCRTICNNVKGGWGFNMSGGVERQQGLRWMPGVESQTLTNFRILGLGFRVEVVSWKQVKQRHGFDVGYKDQSRRLLQVPDQSGCLVVRRVLDCLDVCRHFGFLTHIVACWRHVSMTKTRSSIGLAQENPPWHAVVGHAVRHLGYAWTSRCI